MAFRDKYKDRLTEGTYRKFDFDAEYQSIWKAVVEAHKVKSPKKMKTFEESEKSRKTIASLKMNQNNKKSNETRTPEGTAVGNSSNSIYRRKF